MEEHRSKTEEIREMVARVRRQSFEAIRAARAALQRAGARNKRNT